MHSLAVYVNEGLPFARDISLENSMHFCMFFTDFTTFSVLLLFPLSIAFFVFFMHGFFILFHLTSELLFLKLIEIFTHTVKTFFVNAQSML